MLLTMMSADGDENSLIVKGTGGQHLIVGPTVNGIGGGVEQENVGYRGGEFILVEKGIDDVSQRFRVPGTEGISITKVEGFLNQFRNWISQWPKKSSVERNVNHQFLSIRLRCNL